MIIAKNSLTDFAKNSMIYVSGGSNYASLAVSFSCIVNKIPREDTEAEVPKCLSK